MTHQIRSGSTSNDLYSQQRLHDELRKGDLFCSPAHFETSDLHIELKCYAVELQSQTQLVDPASNSRLSLKRNTNINVYKDDSLANMSPTDTISCESFYSCRSSTSIQDVKHQHESEKNIKQKCNIDNTLKEDFLDQLTMVNALVLSNSVNECLKNSKDKTKSKFTSSSASKNDPPDCNRLPNKYYSGAFTCKINQNCESKMSNVKSKTVIPNKNRFDDEDLLNIQNDNMKETNVLNIPWKGFKDYRNIQGGVEHEQPQKTETGQPKFVFQKKKQNILKLKRSPNVPKITIAKVSSSPNQYNKSEVIEGKCHIEHYKHQIVKGGAFVYVVPTNLVFYTRYVYPKQKEMLIKNRILCGDGNIVYKKIPNSYQQINKYFLGDLGDSQIKTLISQSLQKLQSESRQVSQFCVSLSCKRKSTNFLTYNTGNTDDHFSNIIDLTNKLKLPSAEKYLDSPGNVEKEPPRITEITDIGDANYCHADYLLPEKREGSKRKSSERKSILPVIEEESGECLESVSSEENVTEDCCLTDSLGNPICLFDSGGLPLTDSCGRPLRYADGRLMMKCDEDGLPIIDDDACLIHDMYGRTPHDELFDPSVKPKAAVHNKLSTNDGKPLLLFDTEGRPLTSVSGTMLVDCSGTGLVRLNTRVQHVDSD